MKLLWVLFIIHSYGNEPVAVFDDELSCKIERANIIEARHYKPKYVQCRLTQVTEQKSN